MYALINCEVFTGTAVEHNKAVLISGNTIHGLVPRCDVPFDIPKRDLKGWSVAPGFIDVQVNGGGGVLFNETPTVGGIKAIAQAHRQFGTTNFLPTYITGPNDGMQQAASAVAQCIKNDTVKGVLGIHFEGPFISTRKAGIHDPAFIRPPNDADLETVCSLDRGVTLTTVAPEVVNPDTIRRLRQRGVLISLGHTDASYGTASAAFSAGACGVTHLYNAMSTLTARAPGMVGATLDSENAWAAVIADGHHVDFAAIRVALRAKGRGKIFLVTDAMPPVGSKQSSFFLPPYNVHVHNGRCVTLGNVLAGSALDMATAVRNCVQHIGVPMDEVLRMASTYPAEFLGLGKELGRIEQNYRANLVVFNSQIAVMAAIVEGEFIELT